jgi:hypothetical protein
MAISDWFGGEVGGKAGRWVRYRNTKISERESAEFDPPVPAAGRAIDQETRAISMGLAFANTFVDELVTGSIDGCNGENGNGNAKEQQEQWQDQWEN